MLEDDKTRLVTITRTIEASRDLVFRMWSDPAFLTRWYAPRRCRLEVQRFEFRVGGEFRFRIFEPTAVAAVLSNLQRDSCAIADRL